MWAAYYEVDPWGTERHDLQAGIIASTVYNMARGRGSHAMTPADFMYQADRRPLSPEELQAKIDAAFTIAQGSAARRKGR
jgi:hypothetical protein